MVRVRRVRRIEGRGDGYTRGVRYARASTHTPGIRAPIVGVWIRLQRTRDGILDGIAADTHATRQRNHGLACRVDVTTPYIACADRPDSIRRTPTRGSLRPMA